ncbi:hypothetical protein DYB32_006415 [Aphanomyces invadans]|uniref:EF-hand domain-containing protein n=1 Tax=Aphanomyces invadans TaxID=157072 RepID=A0A418ARS7_9STRA|nr:hypothetical protein DYB32_006415 [Aphanomyces invadans]
MIRDKPMSELRVKVLKNNFKASWITLKKSTKSYVTDRKTLVLFREPMFQTVLPLDLILEAESTPLTTVGPWRIQLRLVESPDFDAQVQERWDLWSVIHASGVTYVLPHAPRYIVNTEDRPAALRGIDKCLTDSMPLVTNQGILQDSTAVVVVTLEYFHSKLLATNHNEDNDTDDDDPSIRQHIQRYHSVIPRSGLYGLEAYGKTGMTKLQQIIDMATSVQQSCRAANDQGVTIGVAVLSSSGRVYTSSSNDLCLDTCPERLAFMKLASDESDFVVEYGQLKDYLAVLDKDRIEVVVKLKEAFDQVDTNRNGVLDFSEIKQALAAMHYDSSASASRSNSTTVSFPEFALAFCHAWTANTRTLPVPKVDLKSVRAAFDRMDTNGNGTLDKAEVAQALSALGQANADDEVIRAAKWFDQVDADGSNSLSFSEFLVRYAELQFSLAPLQSCFDAITGGGDHVNVVALPQMFRSLQVLYDRPKLDKWTDARTKAIRRGRVKRVRDNDEYDVVYSDGEVEKHVAQKHMSRVAGGKQEAWKEGMQVEARGGDSATYYRGEIVRCRTNDTFDIKFKNGAEEDKVPRKWIRPYSKALKNGTSPTHKHEDDDSYDDEFDQDDERSKVPFQVLDVVEARFGGKAHGAYFRGQIAKCRGGGTYDITYDDGDVEKEVSADSIRFVSLEGVARGQAVEARFGGNDKFYPGTIARVHGDGSVDIEYADGDRETRVPSRYVRVSASKAKTQPSDKYFPGKIARVHSDGTVDIHYADGDKESRVIASLVRPSKKTTDATTYDDDDFE